MNFSKLDPAHVGELMMVALECDNPSSFFKTVVMDRANEVHFPELFKMLKISSGPTSEHHPAGETVFDHSMIVLDNASKISTDPVVRLAAMLHDMGKIATPANNHPHHYNHEDLGLPLIAKFCDRLCLSDEIKRICLVSSKNHMKVTMKKAVKWARLGMELETPRQLEALKKTIMADSGHDLSELLDKAFEIGHMTPEQLKLDTDGKSQLAIERMTEDAKVKLLQNILNHH
jgi:tRNA nucleotidyltransferase (CCA-adding enzyme)